MPDNNSLSPQQIHEEKKDSLAKDFLVPEDTVIAIIPEINHQPETPVISPEEAEKIVQDIPKNDDGSFKECNVAAGTLEGITLGMLHIIDSMKEQPSKFSRAAAFWGAMPIWQKIGIGLVITIPLLVVAAFTQMITFAVLSFVAAALYAGIGLLFNDHEATNKGSLDRIKIGIESLSQMLTGLFLFLQNLSRDLGMSVDELKGQNTQFEQNNLNLADEVSNLSNQNNQMNSLMQDIEDSSKNMRNQSTNLITQIQGFFAQLKQINEHQRNELTEQINSLTIAKEAFERLWKGQIEQLTSLINNEESKQKFLAKVDQFIQDDANLKENMKGVLDSFSEENELLKAKTAELELLSRKLAETQLELKCLTEKLTDSQATQMELVEALSKLQAEYVSAIETLKAQREKQPSERQPITASSNTLFSQKPERKPPVDANTEDRAVIDISSYS